MGFQAEFLDQLVRAAAGTEVDIHIFKTDAPVCRHNESGWYREFPLLGCIDHVQIQTPAFKQRLLRRFQ